MTFKEFSLFFSELFFCRLLTIRFRTAQDLQQENAQPTAEMAKLEKLQIELEKTKTAVKKLVPPDYSIFHDLKMVTADELLERKPELQEDADELTGVEHRHFILSEMMKFETTRRKEVMKEIEELTVKKRSLQDEVNFRTVFHITSILCFTKNLEATKSPLEF